MKSSELSKNGSNITGKEVPSLRKATSNDLFVGRMVSYCGTIYRVEYVIDGRVGIVVPGQEGTKIYFPYPGSTYTNFSHWELPITDPFLLIWSDSDSQQYSKVNSRWQVGDRLRVNSPESKFHNWVGFVDSIYYACGNTWVKLLCEQGLIEFMASSPALEAISTERVAA